MPLDPGIADFLVNLHRSEIRPLSVVPIEESRGSLEMFKVLGGEPVRAAVTQDRVIAGQDGDIPIWFY